MLPERTVQDWLARAKQAGEPEEARRCLDEAGRLASDAWDLRRVFQAERDRGSPAGRLEPLARRLLDAAEGEERELHAFTDVAQARLEVLGDRQGAIEALQRAEGHLRRPRESRSSLPVWGWCRVAEAWLELLEDREQATRCLAIAEAQAREPDELCTVAKNRHELLGDLPAAQALVARAEALVQGRDAWTVANAWSALGDPLGAERVLDRELQATREVSVALTLAAAWSSHQQPERAAQAVLHAEGLARSAEDWFQIARARSELHHEPAPIRRALEQAAALTSPEDAELRTRILGAYRRWLGEPWPDQPGPLGRRPSEIRPLLREMPGFTPDADGLFDHLRGRIPAASLEAIAASDYGNDYTEHLAVLTELCASGRLPVEAGSLPWHPHEVLALSRWSRGERVDHLARALCSAVLSCLPQEELDNTIPYLVESALVLGDPAPALAEGMLAWLCCVDEDEPDRAAVLGLSLLLLARDPDDERIGGLIPRIEQRSAEDFLRYCTAAEQWTSLTRGVAGPLAATHPETAARLLAWLAGG